MKNLIVFNVLMCGLLVTSCSLFKGSVTVTTSKNGKTESKTREFENPEEFRQAMRETGQDIGDFYGEIAEDMKVAADELKQTTADLATRLTEVAAPGKVQIGDIDASLAGLAGGRFDFVSSGEFEYVQIGVPTYDNFFKASSELYALAHQLTGVLDSMKSTLEARMGADATAQLNLSQMSSALETAGESDLKASFEAVAKIVPQFASKVSELIAAGQQLAAGAASSITNPKVVLHLDQIVVGVKQSVEVIAKSGVLLAEAAKDIVAM